MAKGYSLNLPSQRQRVSSFFSSQTPSGCQHNGGWSREWYCENKWLWRKLVKKVSKKIIEKNIKATPNLSLFCNTLLTELQRMLFMPSGYKDATLIRQPRTGRC